MFIRKALGLLAIVALVAPLAQANLITNGSFDTDASGWTVSQDGGCGAPIGRPYSGWAPSQAGHDGVVYLNACGHNTGNPNIVTSTPIAGLAVGGLYQLSWDFIRDNLGTQGPAANSFLVEISGFSAFGYNYVSNSIWGTESLLFTATSGSHSFGFASEANNTDASYYIDNVTLESVSGAVPESGTIALLGLGLVGMGLTRRRKKV